MRKITEEVFIEKYKLYKPTIFRIAYSYVLNKDDAEDLTQEVFTKYLVCNTTFSSDVGEKYWLIRVCINASINYISSSWKKKVEINSETINMLKDNENNNSSDILIYVYTLDNKYKEVIILYYYESMSIIEIASYLNISISAVKKRLERARNYLKEKINNNERFK